MISVGKCRKRNNALMVNLEKFLFGKMGFSEWEAKHRELAVPAPPPPFKKMARSLPASWRVVEGGREIRILANKERFPAQTGKITS